MTVSGQVYDIVSGDQSVSVAEVGANLRGYWSGGVAVTHVNSPDVIAPKSSGAVLVPWPNRIAGGRYRFDGQDQQLALSDPALGNASHGLACWVRWTPVARAADRITLACDVVPQKGWPYELHAEITYAVGDSGLTVTLTATNTGIGTLPFGAGCHPYISVGDSPLDDVVVEVDAARVYLVDDHQIPTRAIDVAGTEFDLRDGRPLGDRRLDTGFTELGASGGRGTATVRTPDRATIVWWEAPTFTTIQVFTTAALGDQCAVAIEPMTCPADAFNSGIGLRTLEPGASWSGRWGIDPPHGR